jgi:hypothetical protein
LPPAARPREGSPVPTTQPLPARRVPPIAAAGDSALLWAAHRGDAPVAAALLAGGADADEICALGNRPLHAAAAGGCADIVAALLAKGASPAPRNVFGATPRALARGEVVRGWLRWARWARGPREEGQAGGAVGRSAPARWRSLRRPRVTRPRLCPSRAAGAPEERQRLRQELQQRTERLGGGSGQQHGADKAGAAQADAGSAAAAWALAAGGPGVLSVAAPAPAGHAATAAVADE